MAKSLTDTSIRNLKPRDQDYMVGDGAGLWLRVRTSGAKVFIVRKKAAGKTRIITLGKWPDLSLLEARRKALDPATTAPRQGVTLAELADDSTTARSRRSIGARTTYAATSTSSPTPWANGAWTSSPPGS